MRYTVTIPMDCASRPISTSRSLYTSAFQQPGRPSLIVPPSGWIWHIASGQLRFLPLSAPLYQQCKRNRQHEGPGATQRFRDFLETHAPGTALASRRNEMYQLRSGILHGSELMQFDEDRRVGVWDPPDLNEDELHKELWAITRIAMRNWLRKTHHG